MGPPTRIRAPKGGGLARSLRRPLGLPEWPAVHQVLHPKSRSGAWGGWLLPDPQESCLSGCGESRGFTLSGKHSPTQVLSHTVRATLSTALALQWPLELGCSPQAHSSCWAGEGNPRPAPSPPSGPPHLWLQPRPSLALMSQSRDRGIF